MCIRDRTNIAIGQGDILVTPLQMATAYCGLAMGGVEWTPHVLLSAVARDGEGDAYTYEPKKRLTAEISTAGALDVAYRGVHSMIYEESAVTAAHFTNLPVQVAGKSGTGEKDGEDPYGWFIAYAPFDDPKYVVCAMLERGGFGSTCAMPAVRTVLGCLLYTSRRCVSSSVPRNMPRRASSPHLERGIRGALLVVTA